jgi:hypothetical protein
MTPFQKRCELEALVTEREKMRTHNDYCNAVQSCKDGPFHEQSEFDDLASRMRALAKDDAPEQLPEWIRPLVAAMVSQATSCDCGSRFCTALAALTPEQRRLCEEP